MLWGRRSAARAIAVTTASATLVLGGASIAGAASPPNTPKTGGVAASSHPLHCSSITYVRQASVDLTASATDPDTPGGPLSLSFQVYSSSGRPVGTAQTVAAASGATATASFSLPDGTYYYAVSARDSAGVSAPSTRSGFVIDTTAPATPTIASFTDPPNTWGAPVGSGSFTLRDGASSGVEIYSYSFDSGDLLAPGDQDCSTSGGSAEVGWTAATSGTATLAVPPGLTEGPHTLWVAAIDAAHHESAETDYQFMVSPVLDPAGGNGLLEAESLHPIVSAAVRQTGQATTTVGTAAAIRESSPNFGWSNNGDYRLKPTATVAFDPAKPLQHGAQLSFPVPITVSATYSLGVGLTTFNHYGILQFRLVGPHGTTVLNDPATGKPASFDGYSASLKHAWQYLGPRVLIPGAYRLVVTVVGKDPRSADHGAGDNGLGAGVDYLTVLPVVPGPAVQPLTAQNNDGIAADGTAADMSFGADQNSLSENALAAKGWGFGSAPVIDGVTFSIPPQNGRNDNIVAAGQTVLVSSAPGAKWLDLLVLATSGATPAENLQMNYTNDRYSDTGAPSVPDWWRAPAAASTDPNGQWQLSPAASGLQINLAGHARANTAVVYHLKLAIVDNVLGSDETLQSVSLPNYTTRFRAGSNALHILGIGTSS